MHVATDRGLIATLFLTSSLLSSAALQTAHAAPPPPPGRGILRPPPISPISTCPAPTGAGTVHGSVTSAQTWTLAASPHILPNDISISAPVMIEPCAVVRIAAGRTITINSNGALIATGAVGAPVTIEALVAGSPWSSIRNFGGVLSLTHAVVRWGGAPLSFNPAYMGALFMQTNGQSGTLHVDDVEVSLSASQGVYIDGAVGFDATSQNLRVTGSAGYPVHVFANVIGTIPTGLYTGGNGHNAIAIAGNGGPVSSSQTMHNRGVPYHVGSGMDGGRLDINSQVNGQVAVLTIEPGVQVEFPPGGTLNVDPSTGGSYAMPGAAHGALIAVGTASQPIVFSSDKGNGGAPGDWLGIGFGGVVDPRTNLQHVSVVFAGGATVTGSNSCPYPGRQGQNYAAVRVFGPTQSEFITDSAVMYSARDAIDRGWRADPQPDFLASNSFTAIAACKQSTPRTFAGACPTNPPCP